VHPTQKSEKFSAKLILASSNPGDVVLAPFAGVSTDLVAAKKLGRQYIGIELQEDFALTGLKRLNMAETDSRIQGYHDGVFLDRNIGRKFTSDGAQIGPG
jgi:site-specific DNA-methyltransferase (adenine-specific)